MLKVNTFAKSVPLMDSENIEGMSPPSVFIGRIGYPNVYAGPLVPPVHENTSVYDLPEQWFGKSMDEIVGFRSLLVRGKHRVNVQKFMQSGKILDQTRELALADSCVDIELNLTKKPRGSITLSDDVQPFGPSAPIRDLSVGNTRFDHRVEKAYNDTDLKATQAVRELYSRGVLVSKIQKAFSVGAFGVKKRRKFVPTRWSITAVDSMIGQDMVSRTKACPLINEFRIHYGNFLDNRWAVIFMPTTWRYELIEAWYPKTIWNPYGQEIDIVNSWEFYDGRKTYAEIGGCYYAARMAVNEVLTAERRQAGAVILREAHPGYVLPIGVWNVREHVRATLKSAPKKYGTLNEAMTDVSAFMDIPVKRWMKVSAVLSDFVEQRRIDDFTSKY